MGIDEKTMGRPSWQTTNNFTLKKKKMYKTIQYEGSVERRELYPGGNSDLWASLKFIPEYSITFCV